MSIDWADATGVLVVALLFVAFGLTAAGVETIAGYDVLASGPSALGFLAAGNFGVGVLSAGMFSVGFFAAGIFSVGVFAIGIFSIGVFSFGLYAVGFFAARRHVRGSGDA